MEIAKDRRVGQFIHMVRYARRTERTGSDIATDRGVCREGHRGRLHAEPSPDIIIA